MKKLFTSWLLLAVAVLGFQANATVWLTGNSFSCGWTDSNAIEMTNEEGTIWTYTTDITNGGTGFAFFVDAQGWSNQRGPASGNNSAPTGDWEETTSSGAWSISTAGNYTIQYDTSNNKAKIVLNTAEAFDPAARTFAMTGDAVGGWDMPPAESNYFTNNGDGTYTWTGTVTASSFKLSGVSNTTSFTQDWGIFNGGTIGKSSLAEGDNALSTSFGTGNMTMPVGGDVTLTINNVTETTCNLNITVNQVIIPDPELYIAGSFTNWATGKLAMTYNEEDGSFTLSVNDIPNGAEFKFVDENSNWYGGASANKVITRDNCTEIPLVDGDNFQLPTGGNLTFTVDADKKLSVSGWPKQYAINVQTITNGTVVSDKAAAAIGETVTLTVTPADGYELDALTVTAGYEVQGSSGGARAPIQKIFMGQGTITTTQVDDTHYTFVLPEELPSVLTPNYTDNTEFKVSATFKEIEKTLSIVGDFNGWEAEEMTKDANGNYSITIESVVSGQKFEFLDQDGTWWGGAGPDNTYVVHNEWCTDIGLSSASDKKDFEIQGSGDLTFTVTSDMRLTITGWDPDPVTLAEALDGEEGDVIISSDMKVVVANSNFAIVSDGEGNWLKVIGLIPAEGDVITDLRGEIELDTNPIIEAVTYTNSENSVEVETNRLDLRTIHREALTELKPNEVATFVGYYNAETGELCAFSSGSGLHIEMNTDNMVGTISAGKQQAITGVVGLKQPWTVSNGAPARVAIDDDEAFTNIKIDATAASTPTGVETVKSIDGKEIQGIYNVNGQQVKSADKGVYIIRYTDGSAAKVRF